MLILNLKFEISGDKITFVMKLMKSIIKWKSHKQIISNCHISDIDGDSFKVMYKRNLGDPKVFHLKNQLKSILNKK